MSTITTPRKTLTVNTFPIEEPFERILFYEMLLLAKEAGYTHVRNDFYFRCSAPREPDHDSPITTSKIDIMIKKWKPSKIDYRQIYM